MISGIGTEDERFRRRRPVHEAGDNLMEQGSYGLR